MLYVYAHLVQGRYVCRDGSITADVFVDIYGCSDFGLARYLLVWKQLFYGL